MIKSILIDATHLADEHPTGVEVYSSHLLPLLAQKLIENEVKVTLVGHTPSPLRHIPGISWISSPHQTWWSQRGLLSILQREKPDLFFTPSGLSPIFYQGKVAMTVHDLSVYTFPAAYSPGQKLRLTLLSKKIARKASVLLTPSQFTKSQIKRFWNNSNQKVMVTPLGFSISSTDEEKPLIKDSPFFLFIGRLEHKKNLTPVINAFADLAQKKRVQLVLAGDLGYGSEQILAQVKGLPQSVREQIILPGYVSNPQKNWLFNHCQAVLVPGMVEGFGLPVLEAFAAGGLVICAQAGALPEVGRDGALYVPGPDPREWKTLMQSIMENKIPTKEYQEHGKTILREYTWERTAKLTAKAFLTI